MTYESLMIANQTITKIEVKGKEYAEVNQRIRVFRMLYPNGSIETNIESLEKGICVMSAVVKDDFGSVLGVGHAYEKEDSSFINKTSYHSRRQFTDKCDLHQLHDNLFLAVQFHKRTKVYIRNEPTV